jgi:hypothetical protein
MGACTRRPWRKSKVSDQWWSGLGALGAAGTGAGFAELGFVGGFAHGFAALEGFAFAAGAGAGVGAFFGRFGAERVAGLGVVGVS